MFLKKSIFGVGSAILLYLGTLPMAWSVPINAPNARTLFWGFTLGAADFRFTRETGAGQELNVFEESLTGVYGATRDLTLGLTLPVVQKELEFKTSAGTNSLQANLKRSHRTTTLFTAKSWWNQWVSRI